MGEGIKASISNVDGILNKMNADHPGDIIADILHWCDHYGEDFGSLLRAGFMYHEDECAETNNKELDIF